MGAIKPHKTPVNKTGKWDGARAVVEARNDPATLGYMHAWLDENANPLKKASYKFPHHETGTNTPAIIEAVNLALVRSWEENVPPLEKLAIETHLRQHRIDAGLNAAMSESEIVDAVKYFKDADDLKRAEADALLEAIKLQEKSNVAEWLESRLHLTLTQIADEMFGDGRVTRMEHKVLSGAIGAALDSYHQFLQDNGPQLFARRPWEDAPEDDGQQVSESAVELIEAGDGMFVPLIEKAVRRDGTIPIKIIQPGWGSSGYYPAEVLERDGPKVFTKDLHMYWNHPTMSEETERPERDLNDLAAVLVSDARWDPRGPRGAGLYADAKVFDGYKPAVDNLAENIGVSIRALGKAQQGTVEERTGPIITALTAGKSVDFVTAAGAGGEIITLFEAARVVRADQTKTGVVPAQEATDVANQIKDLEETMDLTELNSRVATLEESNRTLTTDNARLSERLVMRDAQDVVDKALKAATALPDVTKERLRESLALNPPTKDGTLDKDVLAEKIKEAVKAEIKYLEQVAGIGAIRGLGESSSDSDENEGGAEKVEESLVESFSDLGLSESGAKIAAKGRR